MEPREPVRLTASRQLSADVREVAVKEARKLARQVLAASVDFSEVGRGNRLAYVSALHQLHEAATRYGKFVRGDR